MRRERKNEKKKRAEKELDTEDNQERRGSEQDGAGILADLSEGSWGLLWEPGGRRRWEQVETLAASSFPPALPPCIFMYIFIYAYYMVLNSSQLWPLPGFAWCFPLRG